LSTLGFITFQRASGHGAFSAKEKVLKACAAATGVLSFVVSPLSSNRWYLVFCSDEAFL
jgi:hypothetical protein